MFEVALIHQCSTRIVWLQGEGEKLVQDLRDSKDSLVIRTLTQVYESWIHSLALPQTPCVTVSKSHDHAVPLFPHP